MCFVLTREFELKAMDIVVIQDIQLHAMEQDQDVHLCMVHVNLDLLPALPEHQNYVLRPDRIRSHAVRVFVRILYQSLTNMKPQ